MFGGCNWNSGNTECSTPLAETALLHYGAFLMRQEFLPGKLRFRTEFRSTKRIFLMGPESIVRTLKIKQNHQNLAKKKPPTFSPCLKRQESRKEVHPVPYFGDLK